MSTLYLIRHGQASFGSDNYDVLSPIGVKQAVLLGNYASEHNMEFHAVFAGKLERQIDTFQHFAQSYLAPLPSLISDPSFDEHQVTEIFKQQLPTYILKNEALRKAIHEKGRKDPWVKKQILRIFFRVYLDWVNGEIENHDHEDWPSFKNRVTLGISLLKDQLEKQDSIALFTSGGTISVILGYVLGLSDTKMAELNWQVRNSSISELNFSKGKFYLRGFNAIPHLKDPHMITYT